MEKELEEFMGKEFTYENFNVGELREKINKLKEQVRKFEGMQFENSKLIKQLMNNSNYPSNHQKHPHNHNNNSL
jgi:hypothetical protein